MVRAVEKVKQRLLRAVRVLEGAQIPYAIVGGNAVAAWVSRMDEAALRNTQDVDILVQRSDMIDVGLIDANWPLQFPPSHAERLQLLLDDPNG